MGCATAIPSTKAAAMATSSLIGIVSFLFWAQAVSTAVERSQRSGLADRQAGGDFPPCQTGFSQGNQLQEIDLPSRPSFVVNQPRRGRGEFVCTGTAPTKLRPS
jgi:hypothetical protein